ncbi:hypothetical protein NDA14_007195 [Ustilago hordei]|uniref:Related to Dynein light chain 2B, cytoplasmic n=1 Tax=Ustilago hordei TaxID=120017 RepID=I2G0K9_USTHO|nr:hypothetical protein NDA14_007195 [Ustilago hordei]UTT91854.1 hypothetical protein NDA17_004452 [Ustilago hordei]CCF52702.1 related to Dynein light chain 2B, cytoplasmic [Ustilago hordei]
MTDSTQPLAPAPGHISIIAPASHPSSTSAPRPFSTSSLSPNCKSPMPSSSTSTSAPPAEIEATLTRLSSHQGVLGCLVLSRHDGLVIRSGGAMFDPSGPGAKGRAQLLKAVTKLVKTSVEGLSEDLEALDGEAGNGGDQLAFLRVRTKRFEIMVSPNDKYLLVVLQDPNATAQQ